MKVEIIPIGNSRGIRIPKALLEQCGFNDSADIEVKDNRLVLSPAGATRQGWRESFQAMAENGDDALLDSGMIGSSFDESEWEW